MKIATLFDELDKFSQRNGIDETFEKSGMQNIYKTLDLGFFPLGSGILANENSEIDKAELEERCVMVLGNDFGTVTYVENLKEKRETNSPTIRNLEKVGLDLQKTFFTNFYLGLRDNIKHPKTTMVYRQEPLKKEYKELCATFFQKQMELINPSLVICLGQEVKKALIESDILNSFANWKPKTKSIANLYSSNNHVIIVKNQELNIDRTFILIPHPCDLRNFNSTYQNILREFLTT